MQLKTGAAEEGRSQKQERKDEAERRRPQLESGVAKKVRPQK